jgi:hypothetical protein
MLRKARRKVLRPFQGLQWYIGIWVFRIGKFGDWANMLVLRLFDRSDQLTDCGNAITEFSRMSHAHFPIFLPSWRILLDLLHQEVHGF